MMQAFLVQYGIGELFCSKCGAELDWMDDELTQIEYCPYCGAWIDTISNPIPVSTMTYDQYDEMTSRWDR